MASTQVSKIIKAPREVVYKACIDPYMIVLWRVPDSMKGNMHTFDARVGGIYRMSLTYQTGGHLQGKTSENADTFEGKFAEIVPNERIVELVMFESEDPAFVGEMKMTTSFADVKEGTEVTVLCEHIPAGINPGDNEEGCRQSLQKLALLIENNSNDKQ